MILEQRSHHGYELDLSYFATRTDTRTVRPRNECSFGGFHHGFTAWISLGWIDYPSLGIPCQCIAPPDSRIRVQSLHVNGDRGVGRKGVVALLESEKLGMKACGFGDEDYGTVQAKSLKLLKSAKIILEADTSLVNEP